MRRIKKWVVILGMAGPSIVVPSCATAFARAARDGAINGVNIFAQELAFALLDGISDTVNQTPETDAP
jgi:hypothetical protein